MDPLRTSAKDITGISVKGQGGRDMTESDRDAKGPRDWKAYYSATEARPPRPTLLRALSLFEDEGRTKGRAVDLGSGGGRDAVELLRRGWQVLAIDAEPQAAQSLGGRPDLPRSGGLVTRTARFEEARWPEVDLVNASFSLPICRPAAFPAVWAAIRGSLRPGGRFAGQFYGERDDFARDPHLTCHTAEQTAAMLEGLEVEMLDEEEADGVTPRGRRKHWHIRHVVARQP
jgi:SAM-dependent methyltransferase